MSPAKVEAHERMEKADGFGQMGVEKSDKYLNIFSEACNDFLEKATGYDLDFFTAALLCSV